MICKRRLGLLVTIVAAAVACGAHGTLCAAMPDSNMVSRGTDEGRIEIQVNEPDRDGIDDDHIGLGVFTPCKIRVTGSPEEPEENLAVVLKSYARPLWFFVDGVIRPDQIPLELPKNGEWKDFVIWGDETSALKNDIEIRVYSGSDLKAKEDLSVVAVNISADLDRDGSLDGDDEDAEYYSPGLLVVLNDDDDGGSGTLDKDDPPTTNSYEGDLCEIRLSGVPPDLDVGRVVLSAPVGASKVRIWADPHKGTGKLLMDTTDSDLSNDTCTWTLGPSLKLGAIPSAVYVEGIEASGAGDVVLDLRYENTPGASGHVDLLRASVFRMNVAMDGDRDGYIDFDNAADGKYLFWVNDDRDEEVFHALTGKWHEDDKEAGDPDCDDDLVGHSEQVPENGCRRDLEDFTRLRVFVDAIIADMSDVSYHLKGPSVNLFEAVSGTSHYLHHQSVADLQKEKTKLLTVGSAEVDLDSQYLVGGEASSFLVEGKSAGTDDLKLIVKIDGNVLCERSVKLDLRGISAFYEEYVVSLATEGEDEVNDASTLSSASTYAPENDEYVLFVHGWNMPDWEKKRFAETMFKRLWWRGYKGRFGLFNWPTMVLPEWLVTNYGRSELRAWRSAKALQARIENLDTLYPGQVRVLAHSMGNIVVGEALLQCSGTVVKRYLAAQAAVPGNCYDSAVPDYWSDYTTPDVYGHYFSGTGSPNPYFGGVSGKAACLARYYNADDWALGWWRWPNNQRKPHGSSGYHYESAITSYDPYPSGSDRFWRDPWGPTGERTLVFPMDRYEIFARCAESRALPLGQIVPTPEHPVVAGFTTERDLTDLGYDGAHYSHSKQFRSNIVDEWQFWGLAAEDLDVTW